MTASAGSRLLTVLIPMLSAAHRERIRARAEDLGFACEFCDTDAGALALLPETEILFGGALPLGRADRLKWLALPSAGVEPYHVPGALPDGVTLTNSAGAYGVTISEHIIMVTLEMMRRRAEYLDITARREWRRDLPVRSIHGCRAVLAGTGDIGRETARRLRSFAPASVVGVSRSGRCADPGLFDRVLPVSALDTVLPETDLLILSIPGTPESADLLDARRLALLPEGAYLVNVGRGLCLNEEALMAALKSGRLAGAALDVFRQEPLPTNHPLWETPGLLITPHISGNMTLDWTMEQVVSMFLENLSLYAGGQPLRRTVDPDRGY